MSGAFSAYVDRSIQLLQSVIAYRLDDRVSAAIGSITSALSRRLPLLVCGNGESASDSMHIEGELVGRFLVERQSLKVIALGTNPASLTAWSNDYGYEDEFAREVIAYGEAGGVLLGLSA